MTYSAALLYYKGFHAIQAQRISHVLWNSGRKVCISLLSASTSRDALCVDSESLP